jgi:hypothetical protein
VYSQPQSGLAGALNILNAFQSYNNYRRQRARETEADLSNVATMGEKHGQDLYTTPEGSEAASTLGISSDTTGNVFGNIPAQKIKARIAAAQAAHPDTPVTAEELSGAYSAEGQAPPMNVIRSEAETRKAYATRQARKNDLLTKLETLYTKQAMPEDERRNAIIGAMHNQGYGGPENPDEEQQFQQYLNSSGSAVAPLAGAQEKKTEAQTKELGTRSDVEAARAANIRALTQPEVDVKNAQRGLLEARTVALGLEQKIKQMKIDQGGLTAAGKATIDQHIAAIEARIGAAKKAMPASMNPAADKAMIKQLEIYADNQRELIGEARIHGTAPKMGKYEPGASYTSSTGRKAKADEFGNLPETGPPAQ